MRERRERRQKSEVRSRRTHAFAQATGVARKTDCGFGEAEGMEHGEEERIVEGENWRMSKTDIKASSQLPSLFRFGRSPRRSVST
jgi:hypothetical protein